MYCLQKTAQHDSRERMESPDEVWLRGPRRDNRFGLYSNLRIEVAGVVAHYLSSKIPVHNGLE